MTGNANDSRRAAKRLNAIVIERHTLVAEMLAVALPAEHGIRVLASTADAAAAADLLSQYRPDAMLLDLCLDGGGAFDLRERIGSARFRVRVVENSIRAAIPSRLGGSAYAGYQVGVAIAEDD